jgi:hypothetical protein
MKIKKCSNTISGKHLFVDYVESGKSEKFRQRPDVDNPSGYHYVEYFYLKCLACDLIDDSKMFTKSQIDNIREDEGL